MRIKFMPHLFERLNELMPTEDTHLNAEQLAEAKAIVKELRQKLDRTAPAIENPSPLKKIWRQVTGQQKWDEGMNGFLASIDALVKEAYEPTVEKYEDRVAAADQLLSNTVNNPQQPRNSSSPKPGG